MTESTNATTDATTSITSTDATGLTVRRVAGHIGADIEGVDLSLPLSDESVALIRQALHRHKVVFFRGQTLDHATQIAFARQFGELTYAHPHDDTPPEEHPEIFTIDPRRFEERYGKDFLDDYRKTRYSYFDGWHTDVTAAVNPPAGSILRAEHVPEFGGDTQWTNLVAAYEGLSAPVRAFVDTLRAEHRYGGSRRVGGDSDYAKRINGNLLVAVHPVVRVHPETGERALFVNPGFTSHIVGVNARESKLILELLYAEITRPEYTVRLRWEPGQVAFWDNRATAHLAPRDLEHLDVERRLHRVTLIGDVPVGPDGQESELVAGRPFTADHRVAVTS
ncbi:alpha-ketoglutarate-dependent taurine dioxygenase [Kitasatospora sp. MAP12-15]|uniref:TauD/TfdA dioxygenase family protein n=1 Tax=unclassified Kitasatospora TaxID=2633591 RepID=UPI002476E799|nr:TauD/TfdA family dioxygenase [Kitasatospora sp. MAP12-44]MDH6108723.1 alpha-ketoglutarate-dependent taurine dioxygenase [Kitasatospora sp. MAP12-44]